MLEHVPARVEGRIQAIFAAGLTLLIAIAQYRWHEMAPLLLNMTFVVPALLFQWALWLMVPARWKRKRPMWMALLIGGEVLILIGLIGYYSSPPLDEAQQQQRVIEGADQIAPLVEVIRNQQDSLARYENAKSVADQILAQYSQLKSAISLFEQMRGTPDDRDRLAAAEHILAELTAAAARDVQLLRVSNGEILIIRTAPNNFRVTFSVPMRVTPQLTFYDVPRGSSPVVVENSSIGFTVSFVPLSIPVDRFHFAASAELTGG